jgi:hypothetical protein
MIIKLKNIENIINQNKSIGIHQIYDMYKQNYIKCAKINKNTQRGKQISNEYENMVYSEIFNNFAKSIDFKNLHYFEMASPIQQIFYNNENFVDSQIKKSSIFNKSTEYVNFINFKNKIIFLGK